MVRICQETDVLAYCRLWPVSAFHVEHPFRDCPYENGCHKHALSIVVRRKMFIALLKGRRLAVESSKVPVPNMPSLNSDVFNCSHRASTESLTKYKIHSIIHIQIAFRIIKFHYANTYRQP